MNKDILINLLEHGEGAHISDFEECGKCEITFHGGETLWLDFSDIWGLLQKMHLQYNDQDVLNILSKEQE